jgi:hypothetical protein
MLGYYTTVLGTVRVHIATIVHMHNAILTKGVCNVDDTSLACEHEYSVRRVLRVPHSDVAVIVSGVVGNNTKLVPDGARDDQRLAQGLCLRA